jgi:hypothetical protein
MKEILGLIWDGMKRVMKESVRQQENDGKLGVLDSARRSSGIISGSRGFMFRERPIVIISNFPGIK